MSARSCKARAFRCRRATTRRDFRRWGTRTWRSAMGWSMPRRPSRKSERGTIFRSARFPPKITPWPTVVAPHRPRREQGETDGCLGDDQRQARDSEKPDRAKLEEAARLLKE